MSLHKHMKHWRQPQVEKKKNFAKIEIHSSTKKAPMAEGADKTMKIGNYTPPIADSFACAAEARNLFDWYEIMLFVTISFFFLILTMNTAYTPTPTGFNPAS